MTQTCDMKVAWTSKRLALLLYSPRFKCQKGKLWGNTQNWNYRSGFEKAFWFWGRDNWLFLRAKCGLPMLFQRSPNYHYHPCEMCCWGIHSFSRVWQMGSQLELEQWASELLLSLPGQMLPTFTQLCHLLRNAVICTDFASCFDCVWFWWWGFFLFLNGK